MVRDLTEEAADYLRRGARLLPMVRSWRLRSQLRWTIIGGLAIAEKIGKNDACVLSMRPTLGKSDIGLLLRLRLRSNTG